MAYRLDSLWGTWHLWGRWLMGQRTYTSDDLWERWLMGEMTYGRGDLWEWWLMGEMTYGRGDLWERWLMGEVTYGRGDLWERWLMGEVTYGSDWLWVPSIAEVDDLVDWLIDTRLERGCGPCILCHVISRYLVLVVKQQSIMLSAIVLAKTTIKPKQHVIYVSIYRLQQ